MRITGWEGQRQETDLTIKQQDALSISNHMCGTRQEIWKEEKNLVTEKAELKKKCNK